MENLKRFYINGEWVDPISDQSMRVINPATEEKIGTVALGNARDVDLAVEAACAAFDKFSQTKKMDRLEAMLWGMYPVFISTIIVTKFLD